jgi:hypothetical protein
LTVAESVLTEGSCRIDPQGPSAGNCAGDGGDRKQEEGSACEGYGINRGDTEQKATGQFLCSPGAEESDDGTKRGHFETLLQHQPKNVRAAGAECDAHGEFLFALRYEKRNHAVDSDDRQS